MSPEVTTPQNRVEVNNPRRGDKVSPAPTNTREILSKAAFEAYEPHGANNTAPPRSNDKQPGSARPVPDGVEVESLESVKASIGAINNHGALFTPVVDGEVGSGASFRFPNGIVQFRGEKGVRTEFPPDGAPRINGEAIRSVSISSTGRISLTTESGTRAVQPDETDMPVIFINGDGTKILANGDKVANHPDGSTTTQFNPFDAQGRAFERHFRQNGKPPYTVTYFNDGTYSSALDQPAKAPGGQDPLKDLTHQQLKEMKERLKEKVQAGDKDAGDLFQAVDVRMTLMELKSAPNALAAETLGKRLAEQSISGNPHARAALTALMVPPDQAPVWQDLARLQHPYGAQPLPDISTLPGEWQERLRLTAVNGLRESAQKEGLIGNQSKFAMSEAETAALGLFLQAEVSAGRGDSPISQSIRATFGDTVSLKTGAEPRKEDAIRTEVMLKGLSSILLEGKLNDGPGKQELVRQYALLAGSPNNRFIFDQTDGNTVHRFNDIGAGFQRQIEKFQELALQGDKAAIEVLASFTAGAGKFNQLANPTILPPAKYEREPGDQLARTAAGTLIKAAEKSPQLRSLVIESLTGDWQSKDLKNGSKVLETLGKVAALNGDDIPDKVRERLQDGLKDQSTHESAVRGLLAMGKHLDSKDVEALAKNVSPYMVEALKVSAFTLKPERGQQLADLFAEAAFDRFGSAKPEQRATAMKALGAVGPFHATEKSISTLEALGGAQGRSLLDGQLKRETLLAWSADRGNAAIADLQSEAGQALLQIAEKAGDPALKTAAFNALASKDWGEAFRSGAGLNVRGRLLELMRDNPENIAIQAGVPRLVDSLDLNLVDRAPQPGEPRRGSPDMARLAASFRDRGEKIPDRMLERFTDIAVKQHGKEMVEKVSDRLALFNALSPDVRRQLTGFGGTLPEGTTLSLQGRSIDARTFNKLPAGLRKQVFGSEAEMPEAQTLKVNGTISGANWNKLPPHIRASLSPDGQPHLADSPHSAMVVKDKPVDARVFNKLTDEQKNILAGSPYTLHEGGKVPDLSRVKLTAEMFNKLPADLKEALGQPARNVPPGTFVALAGQEIKAETFNRLPLDVREEISGSSNLLEPGRIIRDLSALSIDAKAFNGLPMEQKLSITGTSERLDASLVLGQLANNTINDASSLSHVLLGPPPLEKSVADLKAGAGSNARESEANLQALIQLKEQATRQLGKHSEGGVGWLNKLTAAISNNWSEGQRQFIAAQSQKVFNIASLDEAIKSQNLDAQMSSGRARSFDIAEANQKFAALMRQGKTDQADRVAVELYGNFGRPVLSMAPDISRSLLGSGEGVNAGSLGRLKIAGHAQFDRLQINSSAGAPEGLEQGLKMLAQIKPQNAGDGQRSARMFVDAPLVRQEAFQGIDADPSVRKLNLASQTVAEQLQALNTQIETMRKGGDRFGDFIDDADRRGKIVQQALNSLSPDELRRLHEVRSAMDRSLKDGSITDDTAKRELQKRFDSLDKALMLFDKDYPREKLHPEQMARKQQLEQEVARLNQMQGGWASTEPPKNDPLYKELLHSNNYGASDTNRQYWQIKRDRALNELRGINGELNQRQNLEKRIDFLGKPEARAVTDFSHWMEHDGVELLGAAAGAVIVTSAVIATFGTATPAIALAAAGTIGFMAGRELTKEMQLAGGIRSDGSLYGDYRRGTTLPTEDGQERPMQFWNDVFAPYALEVTAGTAVGFGGSALGGYIGQGLRQLGGTARALFMAENQQALTQLSKNMLQIEGQAARSSWFGRFAQHALQEASVQSIVQPTFSALDHGGKIGLKKLGMAVEDGSMLTSFLASAAVSVPFGAMKPRVLPRPGAEAHGAPSAPNPAEPHLRLAYEGGPRAVEAYIENARNQGLYIENKGNGHFIETNPKTGMKVEWLNAADAGSAKPLEIPLKSADSLPDRPGARTRIDMPEADPQQARRIQEQMDRLLKPAVDKEAALSKVENDHRAFEKNLVERMDKMPETPEGEKQWKELNQQLAELKAEFQRRSEPAKRDAEESRRQIESSDQFQQLKLAKSLAEGKFPPGEYQLRIGGQDGFKLYVGKETYAHTVNGAQGPEQRIASRFAGDSVPVEHVNEMLEALAAAKIKPESIVINNKESGAEGSALKLGKTYELMVNIGVGEQPVRLIYNHETGHLYDARGFRPGATPEARQAITDAYKAMLLKEGGPADKIARMLEKQPGQAFRESLAGELSDPANRDFLSDRSTTPEQRLKYLVSQGEVFAEMYKLHLEKARIIKEGGNPPSYDELLRDYTKKYNPIRAELMSGMQDVFAVLEKNTFNNTPENYKINERALDEAVRTGRLSSEDATGLGSLVQNKRLTAEQLSEALRNAKQPNQGPVRLLPEDARTIVTGRDGQANMVIAKGAKAKVTLLGESTAAVVKGAEVDALGKSFAVLKDASTGTFSEQSVGVLNGRSRAAAYEQAKVTANDTAHVDVPQTFIRNSKPTVELNKQSIADVHASARVMVNGPDATVNVHKGATLVDIEMANGKAAITEAQVSMRGDGEVTVSGKARLVLDVPEGKTMKVKVQSGMPDIQLAAGSRGRVELLDAAGRPIERTIARQEAPAAKQAPAGEVDPFAGGRLGRENAVDLLKGGSVRTVKEFAIGQEPISVFLAVLKEPGGGERPVIVRTGRPPGSELPKPVLDRFALEQKALAASNAFHGEPGRYPAATIRDAEVNGKKVQAMVQEHAGLSLEKFRNTPEFRDMPEAQRRLFNASLEEAIAERHILGDNDFNANNFVVAKDAAGNFVVNNIDFGRAFSGRLLLDWGIGGVANERSFSKFPQQRLSDGARAKAEKFVETLKSNGPDGEAMRKSLKSSGLDDLDITLMRRRAELLLTKGFPAN